MVLGASLSSAEILKSQNDPCTWCGVTVSILVHKVTVFPFKSVGNVILLKGFLRDFLNKQWLPIFFSSLPLQHDVPALTIACFGTTGSLCHGIPCAQESGQSRIAVAKVKPSLRTDFLGSPRKYWAPRCQWKWVSGRWSPLNACCPPHLCMRTCVTPETLTGH